MLPMSSSSSHNAHRRKPYSKRPLARSKSSLLGTIKNIVTAPLAWFASTDDFEDSSADSKGKRRRLIAARTEHTEPMEDEDGRSARNKRMRINSPDRDLQHHQPTLGRGTSGYLDPPTTVFQQQEYQSNNYPARSAFNRSASVTLPATTLPDVPRNTTNSRSTLSPLRRALSHKMSIDPPARPFSRDLAISTASLPPRDRGASTDPSIRPVRPVPRDLSMPPISSRPSFRMRTSMTPQPPQLREVSEPPTLSGLASNPRFVHAPPQVFESQHVQPSQSSGTLGSLVESQRSTRSPVRQHSSLLFGSSTNLEPGNARQQNPAEKALYELDIYKTPLLPTRLRSSKFSDPNAAPSSILASSLPDMFKSRRSSQLVLMQDDKRSERLGKKNSGKGKKDVANESKPYAGEGGMKKLLARRKMEVVDEEGHDGPVDDDASEAADHYEMDDGRKSARKKEKSGTTANTTSSLPDVPSPPPPPPPQADWFTTASSTSTSGSSLRVGRTKASRNHIARPTSRPKAKFSAVFEDDDDTMDDGEQDERRKEKEMLDEATKRAPVFEIPAGFSFSKEMKPIEHDTTNAKEPPISSLPFSFTGAPSIAPATAVEKPKVETPAPVLAFSLGPTNGRTSAPTSVFGTPFRLPTADKLRSSDPLPAVKPVAETSLTTSSGGEGIPNFFASSSAFSKPLAVATPPFSLPVTAPTPVPPVLVSALPTTDATAPGLSFFSSPINDAENPFDSENKKGAPDPAEDTSECDKQSPLFSGLGSNTVSVPPSSLFGGSNNPPTFGQGAASLPSSSSTSLVGIGASDKRESGAPLGSCSLFGGPTNPSPGPNLIPDTRPPFGASATPAPVFSDEAPKSLFGGEPPKSATPSFGGDASQPKNAFGVQAPKATSSPTPFSFDPSTSAVMSEASKLDSGGRDSPPTAEAPKPSFGGGDFSFGQQTTSTVHKVEDPKPNGAPFSFKAPPSTPPVSDAKKAPAFSFAPPATTSSMGFSFSGGSNASDVSRPFSFGDSPVPAVERPMTPPQEEFKMEESPTRDMQLNGNNKPVEPRPIIGGGGFPFNSTPAGTSLFANQWPSSTSTPSSFGGSIKEIGSRENKPFGFGQTSASQSGSAFGFGQIKTPESIEAPRLSVVTPFSFAPTPSSANGTGPSFAFGGPPNASNPFGQAQPSGSAPSSPSTFNQASSFSFTPPAPSANAPFSFGSSQPASPAGSTTGLPAPATPSGFGGGGGFGQASQSSPAPFGAVPLASQTSSGGTLFNIGSAPAPVPGSGPRQIRKLPQRRGAAKR